MEVEFIQSDSSEIEFRYLGSDSIKLETLLENQLQILYFVREIQQTILPGTELNIRATVPEKGSFLLPLLIELKENGFITPDTTGLISSTLASSPIAVTLPKILSTMLLPLGSSISFSWGLFKPSFARLATMPQRWRDLRAA